MFWWNQRNIFSLLVWRACVNKSWLEMDKFFSLSKTWVTYFIKHIISLAKKIKSLYKNSSGSCWYKWLMRVTDVAWQCDHLVPILLCWRQSVMVLRSRIFWPCSWVMQASASCWFLKWRNAFTYSEPYFSWHSKSFPFGSNRGATSKELSLFSMFEILMQYCLTSWHLGSLFLFLISSASTLLPAH